MGYSTHEQKNRRLFDPVQTVLPNFTGWESHQQERS